MAKKHIVKKVNGVKVIKKIGNDPSRTLWTGIRPTVYHTKREYNRNAVKAAFRKEMC